MKHHDRRGAAADRYAEGLSLQAMANRLNAEGVPTLGRKGRWQKGTIGNLLAQAED
jgi:recombinase